ncbi:MAG: class I SAM-dependent methyltransferase [Chitinophagaceae bacterium]
MGKDLKNKIRNEEPAYRRQVPHFMYSFSQLTSKYLRYYLSASNSKGHGMHSPFVFDFITKILNDKTAYPAYDQVEQLRHTLLNDTRSITVKDFGAGSAVDKSNQRTIASIAKNAAKPKKYGQLLYRMVQKYKPATLVELGTSLGITSSYLGLADRNKKLITMEGSPAIAEIARQNFNQLQLNNVELIEGDFRDTLPGIVAGLPSVDFVFIDGNHRRLPTEQYFDLLVKKINNDSILVFDDIHWSKEMEEAWETIKSNKAVRCSIDLFFIGIVFFREEFKEKRDFAIRF